MAKRIGAAAWTAMAVLAAVLSAFSSCGCHRSAGATESIVYVCTETGETFVARPQSVPATNPKTGRRTLERGVYCPECKRWYAAPTSDHRAGNPTALRCRIHKVEMTFDGPADAAPAGPAGT